MKPLGESGWSLKFKTKPTRYCITKDLESQPRSSHALEDTAVKKNILIILKLKSQRRPRPIVKNKMLKAFFILFFTIHFGLAISQPNARWFSNDTFRIKTGRNLLKSKKNETNTLFIYFKSIKRYDLIKVVLNDTLVWVASPFHNLPSSLKNLPKSTHLKFIHIAKELSRKMLN